MQITNLKKFILAAIALLITGTVITVKIAKAPCIPAPGVTSNANSLEK